MHEQPECSKSLQNSQREFLQQERQMHREKYRQCKTALLILKTIGASNLVFHCPGQSRILPSCCWQYDHGVRPWQAFKHLTMALATKGFVV